MPGEPKGMLGALLEEQMNNRSSWLTDDHIRGLLHDIVIGGMSEGKFFKFSKCFSIVLFSCSHSRQHFLNKKCSEIFSKNVSHGLNTKDNYKKD